MAEFLIDGRIRLGKPLGLDKTVSEIKSKLGQINLNNLDVGKDAVKNIKRINDLLGDSSVTARALVQQTDEVTKSYAKAAKAQREANAAIKEGRTTMQQFGEQAGLALRRYGAFAVATSSIFVAVRSISEATKEAIAFEREMIRVEQVTKGSLPGAVDKTRKAIRSLSVEFGTTSKDLVNAAQTFAQAGFNLAETQDAIKAVAKATLAPSFGNVASIVESLIASTRQFNIESKDLGDTLGIINAVSAAYAVEADDLIRSVQRAGGVFAAAAKGIDTGNDSLAKFSALITSVRATTRETADTIATGLRTIIVRLQRPATIAFFRGLGVELTNTRGQVDDTFTAIQKIGALVQSLPDRDVRLGGIVEQLGGIRQASRVIPLLTQTKLQLEALQVAQQGKNSVDEDAVIAQKSLAVQLERTKEQFLSLVGAITNSETFQILTKSILASSRAVFRLAESLSEIIPLLAVIQSAKLATSFFTGGGFKAFRSKLGNPTAPLTLNGGNQVPGTGNTDTVPAMLTPGEFVINKSATKDNLALLEAINSGRMVFANKGGRIARNNRVLRNPKFNEEAEAFRQLAQEQGISPTAIKTIVSDASKTGSLSKASSLISQKLTEISDVSSNNAVRGELDVLERTQDSRKGSQSKRKARASNEQREAQDATRRNQATPRGPSISSKAAVQPIQKAAEAVQKDIEGFFSYFKDPGFKKTIDELTDNLRNLGYSAEQIDNILRTATSGAKGPGEASTLANKNVGALVTKENRKAVEQQKRLNRAQAEAEKATKTRVPIAGRTAGGTRVSSRRQATDSSEIDAAITGARRERAGEKVRRVVSGRSRNTGNVYSRRQDLPLSRQVAIDSPEATRAAIEKREQEKIARRSERVNKKFIGRGRVRADSTGVFYGNRHSYSDKSTNIVGDLATGRFYNKPTSRRSFGSQASSRLDLDADPIDNNLQIETRRKAERRARREEQRRAIIRANSVGRRGEKTALREYTKSQGAALDLNTILPGFNDRTSSTLPLTGTDDQTLIQSEGLSQTDRNRRAATLRSGRRGSGFANLGRRAVGGVASIGRNVSRSARNGQFGGAGLALAFTASQSENPFVSGIGGGVGAGLAAGASFGPQGAAIGAVVGGLTGLVGALKEKAKEIQGIEFDRISKSISSSAEIISSPKSSSKEIQLASSQFLEDLKGLDKNLRADPGILISRAADADLFGRGKGIDDKSIAASRQDENLVETYGTTAEKRSLFLGNSDTVRFLRGNRLDRAGGTTSRVAADAGRLEADILNRATTDITNKKVEAARPGAEAARGTIRDLILSGQRGQITDELRQASVADRFDVQRGGSKSVANFFGKELEDAYAKEAKILNALVQAQSKEIQYINMLGAAADKASGFISVFGDELAASSNDLGNILDRASGGVSVATGTKINPLNNIAALSKQDISAALQNVTDNTGLNIDRNTRRAVEANAALPELSSRLLSTANSGNINSQIPLENIKKLINSELSTGSLSRLASNDKSIISRASQDLKNENIEQFRSNGDLSTLLPSLTGIIDSSTKPIKELIDATNKQQDFLLTSSNQRTGLLQNSTQFQQQLISTDLARQSFTDQATGRNVGSTESIQRELSLTRGLTGGATSARDIGANITRLQDRRNQLLSGPQTADSSRLLSSVNNELQNNINAMKDLGSNVKGLAAIQQELARIEQNRQTAQDAALGIAFASPEQAAQQAKAGAAFQAFQSGGLEGALASGYTREQIGEGFQQRSSILADDELRDRLKTNTLNSLNINKAGATGQFLERRGAFTLEGEGVAARGERAKYDERSAEQQDAIARMSAMNDTYLAEFDSKVNGTFLAGIDRFRSALESLDIPSFVEVAVEHSPINVNISGGELPLQDLGAAIEKRLQEYINKAINKGKEGAP